MVTSAPQHFHNTLASNGWAQSTLPPVVWIVASATTAADSILSANTPPEFLEWDHANGKMKKWVEVAQVWSSCIYMGHPFEVIQSGNEKLLMLSEIIMRDKDGMKDLIQRKWVRTISDTMNILGLKAMSKEQIDPIWYNQQIFPHWNTYLSSSLYSDSPGLSHNFRAWSPADSHWGYSGSSDAYYSYYSPLALRCVVELS